MLEGGQGLPIMGKPSHNTQKEIAEEIKIRAERRAGELLLEMPKKHGARPADTGSQAVTPLKEAGITKNQSSNWQQIAEVPEEEFEKYIETSPEITTTGAGQLYRA